MFIFTGPPMYGGYPPQQPYIHVNDKNDLEKAIRILERIERRKARSEEKKKEEEKKKKEEPKKSGGLSRLEIAVLLTLASPVVGFLYTTLILWASKNTLEAIQTFVK